MNKYQVVYDLLSPGQNYPAVEKAISDSASAVLKIQRTTWLIRTPWTSAQVQTRVRQSMDSNDLLMITGLTGEAAWNGYSAEGNAQIKRFLEAN